MASTDRAFRALARSEPEVVLFRYHLLLVLRHPGRRIRSVALWLVRPPPEQRLESIQQGTVRVDVQTIVLPKLSSTRLLESPETVCFAVGADAEDRTDPELCRLVARALRKQNAGWQRLLLCAAIAAAAGRYDAMIHAMQEAELAPPIIEDLVRYGRERGLREGVEAGRREGVEVRTRDALMQLIAARGLALSVEQRARVDTEHDVGRLMTWLRRAAIANTVLEVFEE